MNSKNTITGYIYATICITLWGTTFVSTKILLPSFSPYEILLIRFLIAYAVLILITPRLQFLGWKKELLLAGAGLSGCTMYQLLENFALLYTQACNVSVIVSSTPLFTALAAGIWLNSKKERLTLRFVVGFVAAITGITLISVNGVAVLQLNPAGDLLALICAIFWAFYSIFTGTINALHLPTASVTRRIYFYALVMLVPFSAIFGIDLDQAHNVIRFSNPANWMNFLFLGVGASAGCFVLWNKSLKMAGVVHTTVFLYLIPVVTIAVSALVLKESLTVVSIAGTLLVLVGLIISGWSLSKNSHTNKKENRFSPDEIIFSVTGNCNLHCAHCFVDRNAKGISIADAIQFLHNATKSGIIKVGFSGGEPLLRPDFVTQVTQAAVDNGLLFDRLMTNGVFGKSESELTRILQQVYNAGFDGKFGLSFDVFHAQTVDQISYFIKSVFQIWKNRNCIEILSVIPTKNSMNEIRRFRKQIEELAKQIGGSICGKQNHKTGHGTLYITAPSNLGDSDEMKLFLPIYFFAQSQTAEQAQVAKNWKSKWFTDDYCTTTGNVLYVHTNGTIAPCCGFANENSQLCIGTVQNSIAELLTNATTNTMIKRCFTTGLGEYRKQCNHNGITFPGKTDDICMFCDYICKNDPEIKSTT